MNSRTWLSIAVFALSLAFALGSSALNNGLAATPPMGWNSWNAFRLDINENRIRSVADSISSNGMKAAGYQYVVVDAGWKNPSRSSDGQLIPDPIKFPSGMKSLADYIHSKGLLFGLYTDAGDEDCDSAGPGSKGHEQRDAQTFASWGVDFMKEDWCASGGLDAPAAYSAMSQAIVQTGRPILFSVCEWGDHQPWYWAPPIANMWRTTGDNEACWDCGQDTYQKDGGYPRGWTLILDAQVPLARHAGPGRWNDPDMLQIGNPAMGLRESKAQFSLWAVLAAPLIAGNDVRSMSNEVRNVLLNKEVIAVDQDPAGVEGTLVMQGHGWNVWARPLTDGGEAIVLFNRSTDPQRVTFDARSIDWTVSTRFKVRDLWKHTDLPVSTGTFSAVVGPHSVTMIRATKTRN